MRSTLIVLIIGLLSLISPAARSHSYVSVTVRVLGLSPELSKALLPTLMIKSAEAEKKLNQERLEALHAAATSEIRAWVEAQGYYHAQIKSMLIKTALGQYVASYEVQLGRPTTLRHSEINVSGQGRDHPGLQCLLRQPPFVAGQQLNHSLYENYKHDLLNQALQQGYLSAHYTRNELRINRSTYQADIILHLNTGPRYKFGSIRFQETPYADLDLQQYVPFCPGSPYTTQSLAELQKNLTDTDLFKKIRVDAKLPALSETPDLDLDFPESKFLEVPLIVHLKAKPTNRYFGKLGYGTDTGPRASVGLEHRRRAYPGHRVNIDLRTSQRLNDANIRYSIPGKHPLTDRFVLGARVLQEKLRDEKYSLHSNVSIANLFKRNNLEHLYSLEYFTESFRDFPGVPNKNVHFLMPSLGWIWTKTSAPTDTDTQLFYPGVRFRLNLKGALKPLFSSTDFSQVQANFKWLIPFRPDTRLIIRGDLGANFATKNDDIPLSLQFFAGGDQSVRGFGYKTLGPTRKSRTGQTEIVGGRYLLVGSLELEQKVYKALSLAVFVDSGNAMNTWNTNFYHGAGFGLRWATPLGPLRLDFAQAMLRPRPKPRIHLSIGMDL